MVFPASHLFNNMICSFIPSRWCLHQAYYLESWLTGTVFKILDARQSEIHVQFIRNASFTLCKSTRKLFRTLKRFQTLLWAESRGNCQQMPRKIFVKVQWEFLTAGRPVFWKPHPWVKIPNNMLNASAENLSTTIRNLYLEALGISEQTLNTLVRFRW